MKKRLKTSILVIEDNPADSKLLEILLQDSSIQYDLYKADTLFDGIAQIKEKTIDLVLLDLTLPDSHGFKTLTNFREKIQHLPVIVLTGTNNEIIGNQSVKAGAQDFLVKGQFDGKLLGRAIRYAIHRHRTQIKMEETTQKLAISEKRFLEAQEMAHIGNWEMDIVSNSMQWADEIYRIFGHHSNSFTPSLSDYMNYVHLDDREAVDSFFEEVAKSGKLQNIEHRIIVDGRTIKHIAVQAKVHFEALDGKIRLVGTIQDISERKLNEQLILEKNYSDQTSKVNEDAFANMGFHIRTPLSSVINLVYLLDNEEIDQGQQELVDGLKESVNDLSVMVNNLLNFSVLVSESITIQEDEIKTQNLLQSMEKILNIKASKFEVSHEFQATQSLPEKFISDSNKLNQLLYNLVQFALVRTTSAGKVVTQINLNQQEQQAYLELSISDEGTKPSPAEISHWLESEHLLASRSEELDSEKMNMLGMAIVTKIVKTMDGTFDIQANSVKGAHYTVQIPVSIPKQIVYIPGKEPSSPVRILLVEDHFLNQIATKKVLTTWSEYVSVDIAENGLIGVEKYRAHGYDLILMDLQMPVMNGIDAAIRIREKSEVPIIALTANASKQEADKCLAIGMNDYLSKPFQPEDLYARIMMLLSTVTN